MSFPNTLYINPVINFNRDDSINLLLASIALEELGMAHLINAEAEKTQYILATLKGQTSQIGPTIADLLRINQSQALRGILKNQMLLQFKLEDIANYIRLGIRVNTATVIADYNGLTVSASNSAYYHTGEV